MRRDAGDKHTTPATASTELWAQAGIWPTPAAQNVKGSSEGSSEGSITRADGKVKDGLSCTIARNRLFPPGPSDSAAWSDTARSCARSQRPLRPSLIASRMAGRLAAFSGRAGRKRGSIPHSWPADGLASRSAFAPPRQWRCLWQQDMRGALLTAARPGVDGSRRSRMKPIAA